MKPASGAGPAADLLARGEDCAGAIGALFETVFTNLAQWRTVLVDLLAVQPVRGLDQGVLALVGGELTRPDPLLVGAGFIAAPGIVEPTGPHFAWWLGPQEDNPLLGTTTEPSQLDLASREYADYLRDFTALEWYRVPETTLTRHITGPYVDHLCTCDYILTMTQEVSVGGNVVGVVGADVLVRRLESDVLPLLRRIGAPAALVGDGGRVVLSTMPAAPVGTLAGRGRPGREHDPGVEIGCPGTSLRVIVAAAEK
ncbi:hypothetical protein [Specibacter cremeus]|uniref:hypothetical protein n=1 Tax=Specibacter cremeus TaxID=1629051 RepID=UPI000F78CA84|nr:hypothetical protein [Specibacter cremeus]